MTERCDVCGQFISLATHGVSWSQTWYIPMSGEPELNDPAFRCETCTDKFGIRDTNCAKPERYQGLVQVARP